LSENFHVLVDCGILSIVTPYVKGKRQSTTYRYNEQAKWKFQSAESSVPASVTITAKALASKLMSGADSSPGCWTRAQPRRKSTAPSGINSTSSGGNVTVISLLSPAQIPALIHDSRACAQDYLKHCWIKCTPIWNLSTATTWSRISAVFRLAQKTCNSTRAKWLTQRARVCLQKLHCHRPALVV